MTTELELALLNQRLEELDARLSQLDVRTQVAALKLAVEALERAVAMGGVHYFGGVHYGAPLDCVSTQRVTAKDDGE